MTAPFEYHASGRSWTAGLVVGAIWAALALGVVYLSVSIWIVWAVALCTLPAVYDLVTARAAHLSLSADSITWSSGRMKGALALADIDYVRLDTRLDMSVRATIAPKAGQKQRLPLDVVPPHHAFEEALIARGVAVRRHHFSLVG